MVDNLFRGKGEVPFLDIHSGFLPPEEIGLKLSSDSLSEQMVLAHSPGIKWVQLSGVLDERSRIRLEMRCRR